MGSYIKLKELSYKREPWRIIANQSKDWRREEDDSSRLICYEILNFFKLHMVENIILESNLLVKKCILLQKKNLNYYIIVKNINNGKFL